MNNFEDLDEAEYIGYRDQQKGVGRINGNPYPADSDASKAWLAGWSDAYRKRLYGTDTEDK